MVFSKFDDQRICFQHEIAQNADPPKNQSSFLKASGNLDYDEFIAEMEVGQTGCISYRTPYDVIYQWFLTSSLFQSSIYLSHSAIYILAEWRSGSVSALPCERPGFASRTRLREIIPANNCTMQGQNNWGNWDSPGVMKLWVAWEVLRWLMKFRELCNGGFHPKLVTPPYHGFLNVNTPPNSQNSKRH